MRSPVSKELRLYVCEGFLTYISHTEHTHTSEILFLA